MGKMLDSLLKAGAVYEMLMVINPFASLVAVGPGFTAGTYVATITAESVNTSRSQNSGEVLVTAKAGNVYEVLRDMGNGWMKVRVNDSGEFLPVFGNVTVEQVGENEMVKAQQDAVEPSDTYKCQRMVSYAIQFVDERYKYGGSDSRTGTDCSRFTRYMLRSSTSISMNRFSGGRAQQGIVVSADQIQPGDLIFYGSGRNINHVAMYIGNGQTVHASTKRTGITVSNQNYRNPMKIVNVLRQDFQYK